MKMKLIKPAVSLTTFTSLLIFTGLFATKIFAAPAAGAVNDVNAFMGVNGPGHVVVGPQLPWGSVNPSPDTADANSSGYNPQRKIRGFSQLHVTGTGSFGKYGQFLISPQVGLNVREDGHDSDKSDEKAGPDEYQVRLKDYNILCELSPTAHTTIYRFTFPQTNEASIAIDLSRSIPANLFHAGYIDEGSV